MDRPLVKRRQKERSGHSKAVAVSQVALIVKTLRQRIGLTLNELAQRSNVAASTISKIEGGQLSPGYEIIVRLAQGLEVDVAELFRSQFAVAATGRRGVTLNGEGTLYDTPNYSYEALVSDVARKEFIPLRTKIRAREHIAWEELPSHGGEEFVFVISGKIRLYSEHYEPLELSPGDSVYFDSRAGHALVSISDEDADVLWICSHVDALTQVRVAAD